MNKTPPSLENLSPERRALLDKLLAEKALAQTNNGSLEYVPRDKEYYPALLAQESMWFLEKMTPNNASYYLPVAFRIKGKIDPKILQDSFDYVCARHESLRTLFVEHEGRLVQKIVPEIEFKLEQVDLSGVSVLDREETVQNLATESARQPFDLVNGPLVRASIFSTSETEHVLILVLHHIIADGTSLSILYNELSLVYNSLELGVNPDLPELKTQLVDYASRQDSQLSKEQSEWYDQLDFWREQLHEPLSTLDLHSDWPRPTIQTFSGAKHFVTLPTEAVSTLGEISASEGSTLFMALLSMFYIVLHRYTAQSDILIGTPYQKREFDGAENAIGLYLNMLVLRANVSDDLTFRQLLEQVKDTTLSAYNNSDLPYELLIKELLPARDFSRAPFVQAIIQYSQMSMPYLRDTEATSLQFDSKTAQFDIALQLYEERGAIRGHFEYNTDLFSEETIAQFTRHFLQLIDSVVKNPDQPIWALQLLTNEEKEQLLELGKIQATPYPAPQCLHELFDEQAVLNPDAIAVKFNDESLTYQALLERSNQVAAYLIQQGVNTNELVGICLERSTDLIVAILGILKSGAAYLPLDTAYPQERIEFMLTDADVKLVISQESLLNTFTGLTVETIMLETVYLSDTQISLPAAQNSVTPSSIAYVIYTSGSTGQPKGVKISHYNVIRLFQATEHWYNFSREDTWTLFHSYAFDFSVWEIWGALLYGGKLVVVPYEISRSPADFYALLCNEQVTVLNQTPSAFRQLVSAEERVEEELRQLKLRYVIFGGEALDLQSLRPWFDKHPDNYPKLINMYGITETTVHVTYRQITTDDLDAKNGSVIGCPIPDLSLHLLDQHKQLVPIGVPGEMHVGGSGVAEGYLNRESLTHERFIESPFPQYDHGTLYRSGDLARRLSNGDIEYLGRIDHQVKIRGFRIEIGEIESCLSEMASIEETVVIVHENSAGDKQLVAYLVSKVPVVDMLSELKEHLRSKLPEYMVPSIFMELDEIPLTQNGKADRRKLPTPTMDRQVSTEYVAPTSDAQKQIANIWSHELGLDTIGIHDNLFELGTNSLQAARVFAKIEDETTVRLPLSLMFESPTILNLSTNLERYQQDTDWSSMVKIRPDGNKPPLYLIHAAGGNVLVYRDLVDQLSPDIPVYGFQAQGLDGTAPILGSIVEMAEHYVQELLNENKNGPYVLGGHCMGGAVALEMAQQLSQMGKDVQLVVLMETVNAAALQNWSPLADDIYVRMQRTGYQLKEVIDLPLNKKAAYLAERAKYAKRRISLWMDMANHRGDAVSLYERKAKQVTDDQTSAVWETNEKANFVYKPQRYEGKVLLLKQYYRQGLSADYGWAEVVGQNLELYKLAPFPGSMLVKPYVQHAATQINNAFRHFD